MTVHGDWGADTFTPSMAVSSEIFHKAFNFSKFKCVNSYAISQLSAKGIFFPPVPLPFLKMETPKHLWTLCAGIWPSSQNKIVFLCSNGLPCISVCPHCHWSCYRAPLEKPGFVFFTPALQVFTDIDRIPPEPSFLQVELSDLSVSPLMAQTLSHICNSFLGSLQYVHVSFVVGNPGLYPAIQMCHIKGEQRGRISQFLVCLTVHLSCPCIFSLSMKDC